MRCQWSTEARQLSFREIQISKKIQFKFKIQIIIWKNYLKKKSFACTHISTNSDREWWEPDTHILSSSKFVADNEKNTKDGKKRTLFSLECKPVAGAVGAVVSDPLLICPIEPQTFRTWLRRNLSLRQPGLIKRAGPGSERSRHSKVVAKRGISKSFGLNFFEVVGEQCQELFLRKHSNDGFFRVAGR